MAVNSLLAQIRLQKKNCQLPKMFTDASSRARVQIEHLEFGGWSLTSTTSVAT